MRTLFFSGMSDDIVYHGEVRDGKQTNDDEMYPAHEFDMKNGGYLCKPIRVQSELAGQSVLVHMLYMGYWTAAVSSDDPDGDDKILPEGWTFATDQSPDTPYSARLLVTGPDDIAAILTETT